ncbi:MAG: formate--tetrahydrofolate ligase, partial [Clostridiales bacterium]|nr:formate--tetrahydrofolate ligase [Clostridiales bacterium]
MPTDIDIARAATPQPIVDFAIKNGIQEESLHPYGKWIGKIDPSYYDHLAEKGNLILVTALSPTPAGEGKTTVSVGLADGLTAIGKRAMLALREPSLGPVFGMKGGATGGGHAQVLPMEDINLHFTGDLHAITAANNLLAAMIDNHIQQGNLLHIDPRQVLWRRCLDVNDRQLRSLVSGLGGKGNGMPREDGFDITAASEIMAIFSLANDINDLKLRLSRILVARTFSGDPITAGDLHAQGALAALLRNALMPNLVQTIDGTPCLMHGGPFANIAHGCNSVIATKTALRLSDYVVTEAGFGADLGAEKFLDIKCRNSGLWPKMVVLVVTIRAIKHHGGCPKELLSEENMDFLAKGMENVYAHLDHIQNIWNLPALVAINRFSQDTQKELDYVAKAMEERKVSCDLCDSWAHGGKGSIALAEKAVGICEESTAIPSYTYDIASPLTDKIQTLAAKIYGAKETVFTTSASKQLKKLEKEGFGNLPVCIAKTQYSFSDQPSLLGA